MNRFWSLTKKGLLPAINHPRQHLHCLLVIQIEGKSFLHLKFNVAKLNEQNMKMLSIGIYLYFENKGVQLLKLTSS